MNGNIDIRAPNRFIARWLLFFVILFLSFVFNSISASALEEYNTSLTSYSYKDCTDSEFNSFLESIVNDKEYNYFLVYYSGLLNKTSLGDEQPVVALYYTKEDIKIDYNGYCLNNFSNSKFVSFTYWEYGGQWSCSFSSGSLSGSILLNKDIINNYGSGEGSCPNIYSGKNNNSIFRTLLAYRINNYSGDSNSIYDFGLVEKQYDKNDLNNYPLDTICVTSPVSESNIKTNGRFINVAIKGKIGIDCTDDISVTKEDLGKIIRNNFRYSFESDKESFDSISYLGPVIETSRGQSPNDDILDILQVLGNEFPIVKGEQIKIAPLNDNWTIGVSGNAKDWTSKKYYNFVINTALYVGENDGDYTYKLNFKVPIGFGMNVIYKTITVDYKLSRGSYVDDDFNGIDDNTNEIIPSEEIEIINPSTSTPVLPSDDGLDDGLQVVNVLKDIYRDFCNGVNGAANILKSFFSVVNSTVQSVVNYSEEMVISFSNIFSFMPSPVPQLITMSLGIMIFVSVLGFIKK